MRGDWARVATIVLAAVALLGLFSTEVEDTDFWWHLKTGQYIVQHRALPAPDPFAYTTASHADAYPGESQVRHFNLTHEWLAQVLLYGVYALGGFPGVALFRAVLLGLMCGLVWLITMRRTDSFYWGLAAAFATASVAVWFTADRPTIVSFFFVALYIALLEFRQFLWVIPALAVVWSNSHGGFFLGWVVLLIYCLDTSRQDRKRVWMVGASAILISFLNPNGVGIVSTLVRYRQSPMTANLVEWHSPYLWGPPYAFDLLLYAVAVVVLLSWRKVSRVDWLLFAAFAGASLLAFRNILLIGILAPILIAAYFPFRLRIPRAAAWIAPVALVAGLATGIARGSVFQLRAALWKFPVGASEFLLANHIPGPLFNTYEYGGYLIWKLWPQYQVFIDGRALSESVNKELQQILYNASSGVDQMNGARTELLDRYGIQTVVMNTFEYNSGAMYPLAIALARSDWQLVYDDAQTLVFLRKLPSGIAAFEDKMQRVVDHLDNECFVNIEHQPEASLCARTLADLWIRSGDRQRGRKMLELYLAHAMDRDPEAERVLRDLGR